MPREHQRALTSEQAALVAEHFRAARMIVRAQKGLGLDPDDAESQAMYCLCRCATQFDGRGQFMSFAAWKIKLELIELRRVRNRQARRRVQFEEDYDPPAPPPPPIDESDVLIGYTSYPFVLKLRYQQGLSQSAVGKLFGRWQRVISRWEDDALEQIRYRLVGRNGYSASYPENVA